MNKDLPKVSIILPTHNRSWILKNAIQSILNQIYTNWELIIIADSCKDNTEEVVKPYLKDSRIHFYKYQNLGGAEARNIGLSYVGGEFIAFLDDDDEWLPEKLSLQIKCLESNSDISIISCGYIKREEGKDLIYHFNRKNRLVYGDLLYENLLGSFSFCVIKKKDLKDFRINSSLKACQDWYLWLKILIASGTHAYIYPETLVIYNSHKGERLSTNVKNKYKSYLIFLKSYWEIFDKKMKCYHLIALQNYKFQYSPPIKNNFYISKLLYKRLIAFFYILKLNPYIIFSILLFPLKKASIVRFIDNFYHSVRY